jgi:hypothetical protein
VKIFKIERSATSNGLWPEWVRGVIFGMMAKEGKVDQASPSKAGDGSLR